MTLLSGSIQPPLLTLLSSTSSPSLSPLFFARTDPSSSSSIIATLPDDDSRNPSDSSETELVPRIESKGSIVHDVVHVQSPSMTDTYIQAGCSLTDFKRRVQKGKAREGALIQPLGVELHWLGMQLKTLGRREMSFEIGLLDSRGREGVVRCSSFKKSPTIHPHRNPPLVHLPLTLPKASPSQLTQWSHVPLNLPSLIALFQTPPRPQTHASDEESNGSAPRKKRKVADLPSGGFGSVTYLRVYANCRVRRIWFSAEGEKTIEAMGRGVRDEWGLYAAET
ncbi:hypothetical protein IAR55_003926 [Kwoniella newhampshirensis]|uniref:CFA20 domain-containing protein n=1 Tax=Kwoniella newhampshirensis TaxID=1651941 RepID=A0AAW0YYG5_9TREE